ncbi:MAG: LPS assembly lipoprotein LptE [Boseongicola sp.]
MRSDPNSKCFDRRVFLLGLAALTGCGFEPVYAPGNRAHGLRGRIDIAEPADEEGFALVRRLEDRLGQSGGGDLALNAEIRLDEEAVGFLPDGSISRYNVLGQVSWSLSDADGPQLSGSERSFTSYSATSTTVATIVAQRNAHERLMIVLADRIVADILAGAEGL